MIDISETTLRNLDFCLLENSLKSRQAAYLFTDRQQSVAAYNASQLHRLFEIISHNQQKGWYAVGYVAYDAAFYLLPLERSGYDSEHRDTPLAHFEFYACRSCLTLTETQWVVAQAARLQQSSLSIGALDFNMSRASYGKGFEQVMAYLREGETYQVNYTAQYHFRYSGNPFLLYQGLRKHVSVEFGAFLPFDSGHVLSFSPELFFTKQGGVIRVRPMKGTVPRVGEAETDARNRAFLQNDIKNRSENLIIVDLLRNDLAALARTGSVETGSLFDIETYQTVYQMTSSIEAKIPSQIPFKTLLGKLFPCGSITGAPKLNTMAIINEVEQESRGLYTGAIGHISPDNDMSFSVAIRTLFLQNGRGQLGVGGGITTRSDAQEEWEEMHLKAQFFCRYAQSMSSSPATGEARSHAFGLVESMRLEAGNYPFLSAHMARLRASAAFWGFVFPALAIRRRLRELAHAHAGGTCRIRLELQADGTVHHSIVPLEEPPGVWKLGRAPEPMPPVGAMIAHKTTAECVRGRYTGWLNQGRARGFDEMLCYTPEGYITETCIGNVVVEQNGQWYTPPAGEGLLPGIYRQHLLETGRVAEKRLTFEDVRQADRIWVCNAVRGMVAAAYEDKC